VVACQFSAILPVVTLAPAGAAGLRGLVRSGLAAKRAKPCCGWLLT
jgi:hypothetical protein